MTAEEIAKKHCWNGHDPSQCDLLRDLKEFEKQIRKELAGEYMDRICSVCGETYYSAALCYKCAEK